MKRKKIKRKIRKINLILYVYWNTFYLFLFYYIRTKKFTNMKNFKEFLLCLILFVLPTIKPNMRNSFSLYFVWNLKSAKKRKRK